MIMTKGVVIVLAVSLLAGCGREKKLTSSSPEALRAYAAGVASWEKFYYPEARASFQHALQLDSLFAMAWCRLAVVDASMENMPAASEAMHKAMAFAPGATEREQLFITMWHRRLEFDNAGAAAAAESLLHLYPDEKEAYLFRGNLYEQIEKDYDAAVHYYQKAVDADTGYAQAVMSLGYAYSDLGDQQRAIEQMERYIRLAPDAADPRASLADLLFRAWRYDDALEQYRESLELKPDYWYAIRQIGNVEAVLGRLHAAEEQYHKSMSFFPAGPQVDAFHLTADGLLSLARHKFPEAAEQFRKALEIDSVNGSAAYGLAQALIRMKQFDAARMVVGRLHAELTRRNLTHAPAMLSYHLMRARLLAGEGNLDEALASCDSALGYSAPLTRLPVYRQMAEIQLARGAFENALDACEEALVVNPNSPDVLLTLTRIYHGRGDTRMVVEIGSRLLALWSEADRDFEDHNELLRLMGKKVP